jgi:ABC-2 type transport system ATP-binding protein
VADDTPAALKARSSKYNAVTLSAKGKGIVPTLEKLPNIGRVQSLENGKIIAFPMAGKSIAADILGAAQQHNWTVSDIKVDEGRLDDVFRQITTTEDTKKEVA